MMELEVGAEGYLAGCVFSSSDKVIKVTGCNFELDSNDGRWQEDNVFTFESSSILSPPLEMPVFTRVLSRFELISFNNHLN